MNTHGFFGNTDSYTKASLLVLVSQAYDTGKLHWIAGGDLDDLVTFVGGKKMGKETILPCSWNTEGILEILSDYYNMPRNMVALKLAASCIG